MPARTSRWVLRPIAVLTAVLLLSPGLVRAQATAIPRPGDNLPPPAAGLVYSQAQVSAARAELALILSDAEAILDGLRDNAIRQVGSSLPQATMEFESIVEESRLELREAWRSFDLVPDQQIPVIAYQQRGLTRQMTAASRIALGGASWAPGSGSRVLDLSDPGWIGPAGGSAAIPAFSGGTAASAATACPNDAGFTCEPDQVGSTACTARDVTACVDACDAIISFLTISNESTPTDIHIVAAGFGVNVPSPIKIVVSILKSIGALACDIVECTVDNLVECTGNETLRVVQEEKRFTDDFELQALEDDLKTKIDSSGGQLLADITSVLATEFNKEDRFTSDEELTALQGSLLGEMSVLRDLNCNIERLLFEPVQKRSGASAACSAPSTPPDSPPPVVPTPPRKKNRVGRSAPRPEPEPADSRPAVASAGLPALQVMGILQMERDLLDERMIPTLYLPASRGGAIEQVRDLVWSTLSAQAELGIAPAETSAATRSARNADELLEAGDYLAAYRGYCQAYRGLIPAP